MYQMITQTCFGFKPRGRFNPPRAKILHSFVLDLRTCLVNPLLSQGLRRMVASLPKNFRAVIILRYQEELDLAEIAQILDLPMKQ